jgi:hypothetical protein
LHTNDAASRLRDQGRAIGARQWHSGNRNGGTVSPDDPSPNDKAQPERKAALDREVRVFLGHRLRAYYDHMQQIPVSDALASLLKQIEPNTDQERHTSP